MGWFRLTKFYDDAKYANSAWRPELVGQVMIFTRGFPAIATDLEGWAIVESEQGITELLRHRYREGLPIDDIEVEAVDHENSIRVIIVDWRCIPTKKERTYNPKDYSGIRLFGEF